MYIGLSTVLLVSHNGETRADFSKIKKAGIDNIELSSPSHSNLESINEIRKNNLNIFSAHSDFINIDISSPDKKIRFDSIRTIMTRIKFLNEIGANIIIVHPGGWYSNQNDKEIRIKYSIESLSQIASYAKEQSVKVAVENLPKEFLADDIETIRMILNETRKLCNLNGTLGLCLDTGHANLTGNLIDYLDIMGDEILTMHIHDNFGDRGNDRKTALDDLHLLPGEGNIKWDIFFKKIGSNYKGGFIFEPIAKNSNGDDGIDYCSLILENLKKLLYSDNFLKKIINSR